MTDTPKGETVSPTDEAAEAARIGPSDARSDANPPAADSPAPADVIAGGTGNDNLATGPGENGGSGIDRGPSRPANNRPSVRRGGPRAIATLVILLPVAARSEEPTSELP